MRLTLHIFAVVMIASGVWAGDLLEVPAKVEASAAKEKVNKKAEQLIKKVLKPKAKRQDLLTVFENHGLVCGPGLWADIKEHKSLKKLTKGVADFQIPVLDKDGKTIRMEKHKGKLLQSPAELMAFWKVLSSTTDFSEIKVRKPETDELRLFWSMVPFKIKEPLFIVETRKRELLVVFSDPGRLMIMWIDDYANLSLVEEKVKESDPSDAKAMKADSHPPDAKALRGAGSNQLTEATALSEESAQVATNAPTAIPPLP